MTVREALAEYKQNILESEELTEALFTKKDKDEWILALHKRAERLTEIYAKDNKLLSFIKKEIQIITGDEMNDAFEALYDLYQEGFDDAPLMIPITERMEEYYSSINDYERLIIAYSVHSYEAHEYISRLDPTVPLDISLYKKILDLRGHYKEIERTNIRGNFFVAYFNIIVAADSIPGVTVDEVYGYLLDVEELYNSEDVMSIDKDNEVFAGYMEEIKRGFLIYAEKYNELPDYIKEDIFKRSKAYVGEDMYQMPRTPFMAYNRCLFERGEITKNEFLKRMEIYFKPKVLHFFDTELDDVRLTDAFEAIASALIVLSLPGDADTDYYFGIIKKLFQDIEAKTKFKRMTPYIHTVIADFLLKSLPYEKNKEEIEQSLFDNLIRRQAPTYIHSVMVMKIAEEIYEYMDKDLLPKMDNPKEFILNAALLHDIGKSRITDIINMQRRALSDSEFRGIRNHPAFGGEILKQNNLLEEYHDIILGHHKWYDGLGGYPNDFDNTKSDKKIIIDLITIADCLDAATDCFGRNYKHPKSVKDVLLEFEKDSGIKYSPYFVNLLKNNRELIYKLEVLTQYKRAEYMYLAYTKGKISE